jgi:signal transduction histidine kinase
MMVVLVGRRCDAFEDLIQLRLDEVRLRQTTQEALAQARIAQQDRLRFFAAANHDLRQPVMAIGIYAELLRRQIDDARTLRPASEPALETLRPNVEALQAAQRGLDGLVGQLLDIDQLESGEAPRRLEPVRLLPMLSRQVQQHQASAVRGGARIVLRCPADATVQGHALQLERVVSNLLDNAVKFAPGGTILLACRRREPGWRIEVRDSGIGIPPEARELVFRDFEQIANPQRDRQRGHGLGLAIVQRIAAQLGATIDLRSAPGRGSTFAITLQQATGKSGNAEEPKPVARDPSAPGTRRVLIVEDDESLGASLAALLLSDGYSATVHGNASEALTAIEAEHFDLALCDVRLPGPTDGFALAAAVQQRRPDLPIVLMSADVDRRMLERADKAGWTTLRKPVSPQALLAVVQRLT